MVIGEAEAAVVEALLAVGALVAVVVAVVPAEVARAEEDGVAAGVEAQGEAPG